MSTVPLSGLGIDASSADTEGIVEVGFVARAVAD
jgi:hypothetical protein